MMKQQPKTVTINKLLKIILLGEAKRFVTELAYLIQRLIIDHLHVIGDI